VRPTEKVELRWVLAQADFPAASEKKLSQVANEPPQVGVFKMFTPKVSVRWDDTFIFIENNGIPAHNMMVGITAWQQQVPIPQDYSGNNAWRLPRYPTVATTPALIKGRFLRGAIAIGVNGIPIFNPQNNRGEVSAEIGELDQWGGHCGRADDYHYHAAPFHLQKIVGEKSPIAFALDGYPIYGLTEPDGKTPSDLDECHGHTTVIGYHYHASTSYPYVIGGFHGEVTEKDKQVDPQPMARPIRKDLPPLRGAVIVGFSNNADENFFSLKYTVSQKPAEVTYTKTSEGVWSFKFVSEDGTVRDETYKTGGGKREGKNESPTGNGAEVKEGGAPPTTGPKDGKGGRGVKTPEDVFDDAEFHFPEISSFVLSSPLIGADKKLPVTYTCDGESLSPPLSWTTPPKGTKSLALLMHHIPGLGDAHVYLVLFHLPADSVGISAGEKKIGQWGINTVNGKTEYAPPCSQGPGEKKYTLTLYALSKEPNFDDGTKVTRSLFLKTVKDSVLAATRIEVIYSRPAGAGAQKKDPERKKL
jgi:hypothetical protein